MQGREGKPFLVNVSKRLSPTPLTNRTKNPAYSGVNGDCLSSRNRYHFCLKRIILSCILRSGIVSPTLKLYPEVFVRVWNLVPVLAYYLE